MTTRSFLFFFSIWIAWGIISSCKRERNSAKDEQITLEANTDSAGSDSMFNSVKGDLTFKQISSYPHSVILTGMPDHRLVSIYKSFDRSKKKDTEISSRYYSSDYYSKGSSEYEEHFMPGIDVLYGYNLLNIAHYDLKNEKLNFLFNHPVLVKTLYYPSFIQDSLDEKPINRNYYLVSVYDEDTNRDTLINNKDLRRIYCFDSACNVKIRLIPPDYSVARSQYDPLNDVMYIFANHDADKNGKCDETDPMHIFWIKLKEPKEALRLY